MKFTKIIATTLMTLSLVSILPTYSAFANTEAEELIASAEKVHLDDTSNIYYKKDNKYYMIKGDVIAKNCIWGTKYATKDGHLAHNEWAYTHYNAGYGVYKDAWRYYGDDFKPLTGYQTINGKKYFLKKNGDLIIGWYKAHFPDEEDKFVWLYAQEDGSIEAGWVKTGDDWYYVNEDGRMLKNTTVDGYTLDKKGKLVK